MSNPWLDAEKARRWQPVRGPGNLLRPLRVEVLLRLIAAHEPRLALDLGCGMGDIDAQLLARCPEARMVCLDGSSVMIERTGGTLGDSISRARLVTADLEAPFEPHPGEAFDVVFSSHTVHHLRAPAKRALYARIFDLLEPGGLFLMSDRVALEAAFWPHLVALWDRVRETGGVEPFGRCEDHASYTAEEEAGGDVPDLLETQLTWLREIGFAPVDSFWRDGDQAVFGGLKPR